MSSEPLLPKRGKDWELFSKCSFDFHDREGKVLSPELCVEPNKELIVVEEGGWRRTWILKWGRRKVVDPFMLILRRGLEPRLISLSAALGLTFGVFPVCGVPLLLCALTAVVLGSNCHMPTLMLANFVVSPFELGLVVPFLRVGELVTGGQRFTLPSGGLWEALTRQKPQAVMFGLLHAIIGWSILAPGLVAILYATFLPVFRYLILRFGTHPLLQHQLSVNDHAMVKQEDTCPDKHAIV